MTTRSAVGAGTATISIAGLTWTRLWRGKAIWVSGVLSAMPMLIALVIGVSPNRIDELLEVSISLLAILPTLHVASSLAEELENRTAAYLWSRPIPRWTIISGKLLALVPLVAVLTIIGAVLAAQKIGALGTTLDVPRVCLGLGLGSIAASCCSAGVATLWPKHGMAIAMTYLLFIDLPIGLIPASLQNLSISHHVRAIVAHDGALAPANLIGLAAISVVWLVVAARRIRRLE